MERERERKKRPESMNNSQSAAAAAGGGGGSLSSVRVNKPLAAVNRLLIGIHVALSTAAIAHRVRHLVQLRHQVEEVMMLLADLTLLFIWALSQAPMWRPVTRHAFPDRLQDDDLPLPGLDVMVVTADPDKEPTLEVMNTVLSAMALDYPGGKLNVYLSDDAGSPLTLLASRKAYAFATRAWVPFCRKYQIHCPCPSNYLLSVDSSSSSEAGLPVPDEERIRIKKLYESLTEDLLSQSQSAAAGTGTGSGSSRWSDKQDHDAHVEIIGEEESNEMMPSLVYVSREKRRTSPHHFKAGALNVLLRVSGLMSNSPYVLVLDCDMKCNSRSSAMEAMCFHLDPDKDRHLAFVQFPQMFGNLSCNDIYCNELRAIFKTRWKGLDGLRGPILSGTGFYLRREALYLCEEDCTMDMKRKDAVEVACCRYEEEDTKMLWGQQVGFLYQSVVEDYFTGYRQLFCRGWTSVYCCPTPPAFLGNVPTNLNDVLVQNKRWMSGMLAVGISRHHCPLLSLPVDVLQSMSFAYYALVSLSAFPVLCYAILTPLSFLRGVPLFPFPCSAASLFVSSNLQHLVEVTVAAKQKRLALRTWWNEQRFWMLNAVTAQLLACVTVFFNLTIDFELTTKKAADDKMYQNGVFDFTGCSALLLPATTLSVLNVAALLAGTWRRIIGTAAGEPLLLLLPQLFLMCYVAALSVPLLEGMFLRHADAARVPPRITALSVAFAAALLAIFGS